MDFGHDGLVRPVILAVRQRVAAKGIEQVEAAERIDLVFLDDATADALEDVVQQASHALRGKGHARFPVGAPAVEGDVEGTQDRVVAAEDDELVVHIRRDLDERVLGRAEDAEQLDARALEAQVIVAVRQRHLAPVHLRLHPDAVRRGMQQVVDEVAVVDAIHAHLDRYQLVGRALLVTDRLVDLVVDVALGMVGMVGQPLGELRHGVQRVEIAVDPVDVALQRGRVDFVGAPAIGRGVVRGNRPALVLVAVEVIAVEEDIFVLRRDRPLVEMDDVGKLHAGDAAAVGGKRMHEKVARRAPVTSPRGVARVGVDHEVLDDAVTAIDLEQHLDVEFAAPAHVKAQLAPTQIKEFLEVVALGEGRAQLRVGGCCVLFGKFHRASWNSCCAAQTGSKVTRKPSWSETRP